MRWTNEETMYWICTETFLYRMWAQKNPFSTAALHIYYFYCILRNFEWLCIDQKLSKHFKSNQVKPDTFVALDSESFCAKTIKIWNWVRKMTPISFLRKINLYIHHQVNVLCFNRSTRFSTTKPSSSIQAIMSFSNVQLAFNLVIVAKY